MRAINKNVFIKPAPKEDIDFDVAVSERALVRNYHGTIAFCEDGLPFIQGDEVCIPHYGVKDMEYEGEEYAVANADDMFAVKAGDTWRPVNKHVKVRKCVNDHIRDESGEIALFMTDNHIESTNWVQIVDVADDCDRMRTEWTGFFCIAPEDDEGLARIGYSKDFCLAEDKIEFVTDGG